jgi:hypothetical protein
MEEPTTMFIACANETCTATITGHKDLIMLEMSIAGWGPGGENHWMMCPRCKAEQ